MNSVCVVSTYPSFIKNVVTATNKGNVLVHQIQELKFALQTI